MQTYKANFWKDYLWILFVNFIIGFTIYFIGIVLLIFAVKSFWGSSSNTVGGFFGLIVGLFLIPIGQLCMWTFLKLSRGKLSFTDKEIIYQYPRLSFFLFYKKEVILYSEIKGISLGATVMKKVCPEDVNAIPSQYFNKYRNIGIEIYFNKNGRDNKLELPIYHDQKYYDELKKLMNNLNLKQTDSKFLFIK